MPHDPVQVTARVTSVLEKLGVRYFVAGSLASTLYGMVRTTQDSDLVAELEIEHIPRFIVELEDAFYIDEKMIANAVSRNSSFNIIHRESYFKVDVFIPSTRPFVKEQFARARIQILSIEPFIQAYVASPEDTLLAKLEWYRMGGEVSEQQWRDVMGVLKVQSETLDFSYLEQTALEIGVKDLLERAVSEI
jgi:hypothetical protein